MSMIRDFKDMVRFHNYQMNELMERTPFYEQGNRRKWPMIDQILVEELNLVALK